MYCLYSLEKVSRGAVWKGIFLKLKASTSLVVIFVIVGVWTPKAMPHVSYAPMVQKHTAMHYLRLIST